jgi:hypothetical protein
MGRQPGRLSRDTRPGALALEGRGDARAFALFRLTPTDEMEYTGGGGITESLKGVKPLNKRLPSVLGDLIGG